MPFDGKRVAPIAARMRGIFGPQGERWLKRAWSSPDEKNMCILAAYTTATLGRAPRTCEEVRASHDVLRGVIERAGFVFSNPPCAIRFDTSGRSAVTDWNDNPKRTFTDILRVLDALEEVELEKADAV